jgi:recombination protein RecA
VSDNILNSLKKVTDKINTYFKLPIAVTGSDLCWSDITCRVPINSFLLTKLLGGGFPVGRIVEISGSPSAGKSTIIEHIMVGFQKYPGISVLIDAETGWYRPRAERIGHDENRHIHLQVDTLEYMFETVMVTLENLRLPGLGIDPKMPIIFVVDPVSSLQTEGEKEGNKYKDGMRSEARIVRENLRKLCPMLPRNNAGMIFASHTFTEFAKKGQSGPPRKKSSTFGEAIKFWSSKRFRVWSSGRLDYPEKRSGIITTVENKKDKISVPFTQIDLPINFKNGIHTGYELLNFLLDNSTYVNKSGHGVTIHDYLPDNKPLFLYKKDLDDKLEEYPDLLLYLEECAEITWNAKY